MESFDSKPSDHEDMLTDHRLEGWAGNSTHAFFTLYSSSGYPASVWEQVSRKVNVLDYNTKENELPWLYKNSNPFDLKWCPI